MSVTTGMVGHGFYDNNSAAQLAAIDYVLPWIETAIGELTLTDKLPAIGFADFGCSEGHNSIAMLKQIVPVLRKYTDRPIQTIHSDLPTNDFSGVFTGLRPAGHSVFEAKNIYSSAVGGSMYEELLPPNSIHFATTFNAIGFLSQRPLEQLPGYIVPNGPSQRVGNGYVSEADYASFEAQARTDVEAFLEARAAELISGGKLLVQVFGAGVEFRTCDGIYDALNDALLELVSSGMIEQSAYVEYYQPVYFRTLDELTAPFRDFTLPTAGLFRLDRAETYEIAVPFVEEFRSSGDESRYSSACTAFFRAFTEPVLRINFRMIANLDSLIEEIYQRAERLIRNDPEKYEFHYIAIAALATRL